MIPAIHRSNIKQIDAVIYGSMDDAGGLFVAGVVPVAAEVPAANTDDEICSSIFATFCISCSFLLGNILRLLPLHSAGGVACRQRFYI